MPDLFSPISHRTLDSASLSSDVYEYEYENGRRYHGYKAGSYPLPNDDVCSASDSFLQR